MHILFLSLMKYAWLCVSHMHREEHTADCGEDHFMLYGESAGLTPDTNGPPSFPCMKNQLTNVTRVLKKKKIADIDLTHSA